MIGACAAQFDIVPEEDGHQHQWLTEDKEGGSNVFPFPVTVHPVHPIYMRRLHKEWESAHVHSVAGITTNASVQEEVVGPAPAPTPVTGNPRELPDQMSTLHASPRPAAKDTPMQQQQQVSNPRAQKWNQGW